MGQQTWRALRRSTIAGAAAVLALGVTGVAAVDASAAPALHIRVSATLGSTTMHHSLNRPTAIASGAHHLWIANLKGNSVTETNLRGAFVRSLSAAKYGFHSPDAITVVGTHVFVLSRHGSVTEFSASDGSLVRIIRGARYDFGRPTALIALNGNIWVVDHGSSAVTEFRIGDGSLVRVLNQHNKAYKLSDPVALSAAGGNIWVLNEAGVKGSPSAGSLTEIAAATGALKRVVHGTGLGLNGSRGIAFDGKHLWVSDSATNSVTELTSTGALKQVIANTSNNSNYGFDAPTVVAAHGGHVYVISPPGSSPMVTQIEPATAAGNWFECNTNTPDPHFVNPTGLAVQGNHVWVVSPGNNSLAELHTSTGLLVRDFT